MGLGASLLRLYHAFGGRSTLRADGSRPLVEDQLRSAAQQGGIFVLSLDFEGYWGMRHQPWVDSYNENLANAGQAAIAILDLFRERQIHCTWAAVGFLFAETPEDLRAAIPDRKPQYANPRLAPYADLAGIEFNQNGGPLKTAPSLIRLIRDSPGQEIATHTFSHFFCMAEGQTIDDFVADLDAACKIAARQNVRFSSIIFPRNQCNQEYLEALGRFGINCYRGTEDSWLYRGPLHPRLVPVQRLLRLLDNYVNATGHHTYPIPGEPPSLPVNIPSSRFLRPFMPSLRILEPLRLARIKRGLYHAARRGEIFHLWWHPHNFGKNLDENLRFLTQILDYYSSLSDRFGMKNLNMSEVASQAISRSGS